MLVSCAILLSFALGHDAGDKSASDPKVDDFVHTPPGSTRPGRVVTTRPAVGGTLRVRVLDEVTKRPTPCRVNVLGPDGDFYEPHDNPLAAWSLHRAGNRKGKGPFRYFGWFFYTTGEFVVHVPPGRNTIEVWRGFEYRPVLVAVDIPADREIIQEVPIRRTINMEARGWHGGDTHIHLNRRDEEDTGRILDLMQAEDIRIGHILCMNDPKSYVGNMDTQTWPQPERMGRDSIAARGGYMIVSGQEYRTQTYGHICLLLGDQLVLPASTIAPNEWPIFGEIVRHTRAQRGVAIHAHGGYEQEIYADYAQYAADGVELLQFAEYRGIALQGWYHILNAGYQLPAVGACDYPYCRVLGDSRTYARFEGRVDPAAWTDAVIQGRSFFTTGPMLLLSVDGQEPGAAIRLNGPAQVKVKLEVIAEVGMIQHVELIANGSIVHRMTPSANKSQGQREAWVMELPIRESTWIAARAYSTSINGLPDGEAHTNPVYVRINDRPVYQPASVEWLLARLDAFIAANKDRTFTQLPQVLAYLNASRAALECIKHAGGLNLSQVPTSQP